VLFRSCTLAGMLNGYFEQISDAIENEDWDRLCSILSLRQSSLETFFRNEISELERAAIIGVIHKMHAEDQRFLAALDLRRAELKKEVVLLRQGRKGIRAYQGG